MIRTQAIENTRTLVRIWHETDSLPFREIGEWLGVTRERAWQIYKASGGPTTSPRPYGLHARRDEDRSYKVLRFKTKQARAHRARFMRAHGYVLKYVDKEP